MADMFKKNSGRVRQLTMACATALALALTSPAMAALTGEALELSNEAKAYVEKGDLRAAVIQLKNAIRKNPDEPELRLQLGELYILVGQGDPAEKEIRRALEKGIDEELIQVPYAQALLLANRAEDALSKTSLDLVPVDKKHQLMALHAQAHLVLKDLATAEEMAREAVAAKPDFPLSTSILATILVQQDRKTDADGVLDEFLAKYEPNTRILFQKGELRRIELDLDSAKSLYDRALGIQPNHLPSLVSRGLVLLEENDLEAAQRDVDQILSKAPGHLSGNFLQAMLLFRDRKFKEADDVLEGLGDGLRRLPPALYLAANIKFALQDVEQAKNYIDLYQQVEPENALGHSLNGAILLQMGKVEEAIRSLETAVEKAPQNFGTLILLGNAYTRNGDYQKATEIFERAQAINPENVMLRTQSAVSQMGLGNQEQAIAGLKALIDEGENLEQVGFALVLIHLRAREMDKALAVVDQLEEKLGDTPLPDFYRANIKRIERQTDEAKALYRKVVTNYPDFEQGRLNLATLLIETGDFEEARSELDRLLKINPKNATAIRQMGRIAELQADDMEAERLIREAIRLEPNRPEHQYDLVQFLMRINRTKEAHSAAKTLSVKFPELPQGYQAWAQTSTAIGEEHEALAALNRLARLAPENAPVHLNMARMYQRNKEFPLARKHYRKALRISEDFEPARVGLMNLVLQTDGVDAAIDELKQTTGISDPDELQMNRAALLIRSEQFDDGLSILKDLIDKDPETRLAPVYFNAMRRAGKNSEGAAWLENWIAANPEDSNSIMALANYKLNNQDMDGAAALYLTMTKLKPEDPVPWNNLAWIYGRQGNSEALAMARQAYEKSSQAAVVADTYGWLLYQAGQTEESAAILKRAYVEAGNNAEIAYHYAVLLNAQGQTAEAKKLLQKIVKSPAKFADRGDAEALLKKLN